jgi:cation/acetate symporter
VIHETSYTAIGVFAFFVAVVLGISFYLGAKAKSASGYYAAHGQIPWFVNGVAFAGDYLSAASFLGICGMIAFYGYDGFLYSIGYLAGWIVALLVIAEPLKRLGKFTFADALDSQFNSRGIKLAAAISTLVVSVFYLIPQMVGAGALVKPLLGLSHEVGVVTVGVVVVLIVVTAGMVSTTWVQFIKGAMLVVFCAILVGMILFRGLTDDPRNIDPSFRRIWERSTDEDELQESNKDSFELLPPSGPWSEKPYVRTQDVETGRIRIWRRVPQTADLLETQFAIVPKDGSSKIVNGLVWGRGKGQADFDPVGEISYLPNDARRDEQVWLGLLIREEQPLGNNTGPIDPVSYLEVLQRSNIVTWGVEKIEDEEATYTIFYPKITAGADLLTPGGSPTFAAIRKPWYVTKDNREVLDWTAVWSKLDFLSLMIALFGGTASLPHILIRYYTVKDQASARKSTVVGIASIGFFYVLTLFLGLGAMTSGTLDVTDSNMAAPLLARSFGELPFAVISAIAFTTVLGTVSGLILAASGAVAHDFLSKFLQLDLNDHAKVRAGKITAVVVGVVAMVLGILFQGMNVSFLVGWAFNVAASANLPSLVMLLFWRGTTKQGITAAILVGMITSLAWILLSAQAYKDVYGINPADALVPFSQPGILTIPLGFVVLVVVSLMTRSSKPRPLVGVIGGAP